MLWLTTCLINHSGKGFLFFFRKVDGLFEDDGFTSLPVGNEDAFESAGQTVAHGGAFVGRAHGDFVYASVRGEDNFHVGDVTRAFDFLVIAFGSLVGATSQHVFDVVHVRVMWILGRRCFVHRSGIGVQRCAFEWVFVFGGCFDTG